MIQFLLQYPNISNHIINHQAKIQNRFQTAEHSFATLSAICFDRQARNGDLQKELLLREEERKRFRDPERVRDSKAGRNGFVLRIEHRRKLGKEQIVFDLRKYQNRFDYSGLSACHFEATDDKFGSLSEFIPRAC